MENVKDVKEALSAKSRTATLDELRNEGRRKVRLIKAEHVAAMVTEAVHAAVEASGLIPQSEVEKLVDKSRQEFKDILQEREQEQQEARQLKEQLAHKEGELGRLSAQLHEVQQALEATQGELDNARQGLAGVELQLTEDHPVGGAGKGAGASAGAGANQLMAMMMKELAGLKASMEKPKAAAGADLNAALEKLSGNLNDRLEKLGKKMGVSAAVEGSDLKFDGLFKDDGKTLESNMDNIQVKKKEGGGIAANLAKLKKLKGGG
jgi:septal ring factor EnvC (AmiA/AmiB activator)